MGKFKIDENLPIEASGILRSAGHDAMSVIEQKMAGQTDEKIAAVCQKEGRIVITLDLDFADIRVYPPAEYAGIIVLRLARLDKLRVLSVIESLLPLIDREPLKGKLWIVDESSIRIRA